MTNNLVDYVTTEEPHDIHHALFPGKKWEQMQEEWDSLSMGPMWELQDALQRHINQLSLPTTREQVTLVQTFPKGFHRYIAYIVDEALPQWNVAQKSMLWHTLSHVLYRYSQALWANRVQEDVEPDKECFDVQAN